MLKTKSHFLLAQWAKLLVALGKAESITAHYSPFETQQWGEKFQSHYNFIKSISALLSCSWNTCY